MCHGDAACAGLAGLLGELDGWMDGCGGCYVMPFLGVREEGRWLVNGGLGLAWVWLGSGLGGSW